MIYTMVIVDDEKYGRESLINIVDWEEHEINIVALSESGEEGERIISELKPDIVLTDICMKKMSGLDMINRLKQKGIDSSFIVVTAYSQFEYVKTALEYNVVRYLLKPIKRDELLAALETAKGEIRKKYNYSLLKEILSDEHRFKSFGETSGEMPPESRGYYIVLSRSPITNAENKARYYEILKNRTDENYILFTDEGIMMISGEDTTAVLSRVDRLGEVFGGEVFVGISNICDTYVNLSIQMYQAARFSFYYDPKVGDENKMFFSDIPTDNKNSAKELLKDEFKAITDAVCKCDNALLKAEVNAALDKITKTRPIPIRIESWYERLVVRYKEIMESYDISQSDIIRDFDERKFMKASPECFKKDTLFKLIFNIGTKISEHIMGYQIKAQNKNINEVISYVDEHFTEDISLVQLSGMFYIKESWLSMLFKRKTGKNYLQYISEKRMEEAKKLLVDLTLPIYDVADRVGYTDAKYFSQLFKKITGELPKEYRNRIMGK